MPETLFTRTVIDGIMKNGMQKVETTDLYVRKAAAGTVVVRRGYIMKKWKGVLTVFLAASCLGGCSQFKAEHNAVKLKKDGSVQAAVIDTLDKSYYSREELEKAVDDAVAQYNDSQEKSPIVVKKFSGEESNVELYIDYAAAEDYQKFNNVTFYVGDLQGAYDGKYEFPDEFLKVENGKVTETVTRSDILSGLNYEVLIYSEEMDVEVPGKILYISSDAMVTGRKTATNIPEEIQKQEETETSGTSEEETQADGAEKGQFEVESDSETQTETADDSGEETKHTLTYVIYQM